MSYQYAASKGTPASKGNVTLTCKDCQRALLVLFYSAVCNHCESPPKGTFYRGYVAHNLVAPAYVRTSGENHIMDYVWRTPHDAIMWRNLQGMEEKAEIRVVLSEHTFAWRVASGLAAGLVSADRLVEIHPDHRYAPAPYKAFLMPKEFSAYSEMVKL